MEELLHTHAEEQAVTRGELELLAAENDRLADDLRRKEEEEEGGGGGGGDVEGAERGRRGDRISSPTDDARRSPGASSPKSKAAADAERRRLEYAVAEHAAERRSQEDLILQVCV